MKKEYILKVRMEMKEADKLKKMALKAGYEDISSFVRHVFKQVLEGKNGKR